LTPDERNRFNWSKQLISIAKEHNKEARSIYDFEKTVMLIEIEIRDLKKDNQHLKTQIDREQAVLDQLLLKKTSDSTEPTDEQAEEDETNIIVDYVPHFILGLVKYEPYMKTKRDLKNLISNQKYKIKKMHRKIAKNERKIKRLSAKLIVEKEKLEANKSQLLARKTTLQERATHLRAEIDKLVSGSEEYATTELAQMELEPGKRKWKRIKTSGRRTIPSPTESEMAKTQEEKPEILRQLAQQAADEKGVLIPYHNQFKGNWGEYLKGVLIGENDRTRTPDDAIPFLLK